MHVIILLGLLGYKFGSQYKFDRILVIKNKKLEMRGGCNRHGRVFHIFPLSM